MVLKNIRNTIFVSLFSLLLVNCGATTETTLNEDIPTTKESSSPNTDDKEELPKNDDNNSLPTENENNDLQIKFSGNFQYGVHKVSGMAKIINSNNKDILRLEEFNTENGPDLHVYLVKNSTGLPNGNSDFLDLGELKSTNGNFNYDIPENTNLSEFKSVSIWCKSFSVKFGFAELK